VIANTPLVQQDMKSLIKAPIIVETDQHIPILKPEDKEDVPFDYSRGFVIVVNTHTDGTYSFRKAYTEEKEESDVEQALVDAYAAQPTGLTL